MIKKTLYASILAALAISATAASANLFLQEPGEKPQVSKGAEVAHHRHSHRHCHRTLSLGHIKKRCHTHTHSKAIHHGPQFH